MRQHDTLSKVKKQSTSFFVLQLFCSPILFLFVGNWAVVYIISNFWSIIISKMISFSRASVILGAQLLPQVWVQLEKTFKHEKNMYYEIQKNSHTFCKSTTSDLNLCFHLCGVFRSTFEIPSVEPVHCSILEEYMKSRWMT